MTTEKQIEANRENAKLGGVKTEEGKAVSCYNAVKHGLLSQKVLFKGEDEATLAELGERLRADLKPSTEMETVLADRIVANLWRLQRAMGLERESVMSNFEGLANDADIFFRYEVMLERGIYKALHELQRMQAHRVGEKPPAPVAVDVDISRD